MSLKSTSRMFFMVLALCLFILAATGCGKKASTTPDNTQKDSTQSTTHDSTQSTTPVKVQIEMESGGKMVLELYPEFAPETVANFTKLAKDGFYNGLTFHRIMKGFMIQGGDPKGTGKEGSDKNIKGEFAQNGFPQNTLKHTRGVISMARSTGLDSASSQFFIMDATNTSLDGSYAAFGKLIEGDTVLDEIANTPVKPNPNEASTPITPPKIKTITVLN